MAWAAVSTSDMDQSSRLTTQDVVWYASGHGPRSGEFHVSGLRKGRKLETGFVLLRIEEDRIADGWSVPRDRHGVDKFWA